MQSSMSKSPALVASLFAAVVLHIAVAFGFLRLEGARAATPNPPGAFTVVVLPEAPISEAPLSAAEPEPITQPEPAPEPLSEPIPEPEPAPKPAPKAEPPPSPKPKVPPRPKSTGLRQTAPRTSSESGVTAQAPGDVETFSPPMSHADYLDNPRPHYPRQARRLRQEGRVLIEVRVSTDGLPLSVGLKSSAGFDLLDRAALEAVRHWRFVPARRGGRPVEASVVVPIQFVLEEQ